MNKVKIEVDFGVVNNPVRSIYVQGWLYDYIAKYTLTICITM